MRRGIWLGGLLALVFLAGATAAGVVVRDYGRIATGFFAKGLCSGVFVAGRAPADVVRDDLRVYPPAAVFSRIEWDIDQPHSQVQARLPWSLASARAIHRPGQGCALQYGPPASRESSPPGVAAGVTAGMAVGTTAGVAVGSMATRSLDTQRQPDPALAWPAGSAVDDQTLSQAQRSRLAAALERGFSEVDPSVARRTRAIVVVQHGRLLAQRYAAGFDERTPMAGWSMAKSVTAAWIGTLVRAGRLRLDDPVDLAAWRAADDGRRQLSFRQLLNMSSGLAFSEVYDSPWSDVTRMLFFSADAAAFAASRPIEQAPDAVFNYSSGTTNILSLVLRERLREQYPDSPARALFEPLGMASARFEADASGTFVGSSYLWANAHDWARFGLLFAQDGQWNGQPLLPADWVRWSRTASPASRRYGAHWWLAESSDPTGQPLPEDFFQATGHGGQRLSILPGEGLVIVRLGMTLSPQALRHVELINDIRAALR